MDHPHIQELLELLARTGPDPAPAQVRQQVGERTPQQLIELTAGARTLGRTFQKVEEALGSLARVRGADDNALADAVGVHLRTLYRRYPRPMLKTTNPGGALTALVQTDEHGQALPLALELSVPEQELRLSTAQGSEPVLAGALHRWPLPLLTGPGAQSLLQTLAPLAQQMLVGADLVQGAYVLDQEAATAEQEIAMVCTRAWRIYPVLRQVAAKEHFADLSPAEAAGALGLPPGAGPGQVAAAAELARTNALAQLCLLTGAEAYLAAAVAGQPSDTEDNADHDAGEGDAKAVRTAAEQIVEIDGRVLGTCNVAADHHGGTLPHGHLPRGVLDRMARAGLIDSAQSRRLTDLARTALPVATEIFLGRQ